MIVSVNSRMLFETARRLSMISSRFSEFADIRLFSRVVSSFACVEFVSSLSMGGLKNGIIFRDHGVNVGDQVVGLRGGRLEIVEKLRTELGALLH